jgi:general secretion pathway protein A
VKVVSGEFSSDKQRLIYMNEPEIRKEFSEEDAPSVCPVVTVPVRSAERPLGAVERRGLDRLLLDYYGLNEQPFGVTPDLRFLYLGAKHQQALDVLNYGTELNRGFLTLIARPGMGKTSLLFRYLGGLGDKARTAYLFQTDCDSTELMRYLLAELDLNGKGMDLPEMRAVLGQVLLDEMKAGRRFVLVIDEAQNLDEKVLESIRLLSNFETPWMKLMHIILAGQPQLADKLARPSMTQLRQRVSFAIRIEPFTRGEVDLYINHRLWVAGYRGLPLFSVGARTLIAERSEGTPRTINNMCFCAMAYTLAMKRKTIDRDTMSEVLADLDPESPVEKEKECSASITPVDTKPSDSKPFQPVGLTWNPPPNRGRIQKVAVVFAAMFALGWIGLQSDVQRWMGSSYNAISTSVRSFLAPTNAQSAPNPRSTDGPENTSTTRKSEVLSKEKRMRVPSQDGSGSSSRATGQN